MESTKTVEHIHYKKRISTYVHLTSSPRIPFLRIPSIRCGISSKSKLEAGSIMCTRTALQMCHKYGSIPQKNPSDMSFIHMQFAYAPYVIYICTRFEGQRTRRNTKLCSVVLTLMLLTYFPKRESSLRYRNIPPS